MNITFFNQDFTKRLQPDAFWTVRKMEWRAEGGCYSAEIDLAGGSPDVSALLRSPVEIHDERGGLTWWGFVDSVQSPGYTVSLADMVNRVAVAYVYDGPDKTLQGKRQLTAWASDTGSILYYGSHSRIMSIGKANDLLAKSKRDIYLANHAYPHIHPLLEQGTLPAKITCAGWWSTLGWRYYSYLSGRVEYAMPPGGNNTYYGVGGDWRSYRVAAPVKKAVETASMASIWLQVRKIGAPVDDFIVSFCASVPDGMLTKPGAVIGSGLVIGTRVSTSVQWMEFVLNTPTGALAAGTEYFIMLSRSGGLDAENNYEVVIDSDWNCGSAIYSDWSGAGNWHSWPGALLYRLRGLATVDSQITAMCDGLSLLGRDDPAWQFFTGVRIDQATGHSSDPYRDGMRTALVEVRELLGAGDSSGRRLLATGDQNRLILIRPEATTTDYIGLRSLFLQEVRGNDLVGHWSRLAGVDMLPVGQPVVGGQDGFIEKVTWMDGGMKAEFSY